MKEEIVHMTKYLEFWRVESNLTAKRYEVRGKTDRLGDQFVLGQIEYCLAWQSYVLVPTASTQWSRSCLQDVVKFIEGVEAGRI